MTEAPRVSVVLPVHNAGRFLDRCIESILCQDFEDFELIILDDGSTDGSGDRLRQWAKSDPRIRLTTGEVRLGAAPSSNRVVELARSSLVARIDADDIMLPRRISRQVEAMDARPDAVLVAGLAWTIDASGRRVRAPDIARLCDVSRYAPFPHSSIMFRRHVWQDIGGYRREAEKWEDLDLFTRISACGEIWVMPEPLIEYRQHADSTRLIAGLEDLERAMDGMCRHFDSRDGANPRRGSPRRITPGAYRFIGAMLLWSGDRPRLLGRILRRAELGLNRETALVLCWAAMAEAAPGLLRLMLRARLAVRNRLARRTLAGRTLVRWLPEASAAGSG